LLATATSFAQDKKPRESPLDSAMGKIGTANVKIVYSSPAVKNRAIWGELVPFDKVWRTGANEATTFSTDKPLMVEGKALPAGKYAFFAIPGKESWTIIFNKTAKQWGAYDYKEADDALRVTVKPKMEAAVQERLKYHVAENGFGLAWEKLHLHVSAK
jgi:hypothetical protein